MPEAVWRETMDALSAAEHVFFFTNTTIIGLISIAIRYFLGCSKLLHNLVKVLELMEMLVRQLEVIMPLVAALKVLLLGLLLMGMPQALMAKVA